MENLINKIKQYFDTGAYDSEELVRSHICYPVLRELDWDTESPVHLIPEYNVRNLRVDIALCHSPKEPVIFMEIKAPGKCSPQGQEQVFEYAARQGGIPMIIFTDGDEWHFYNSYGTGTYDSKKVKSIQLTKDNIDECMEYFSRYLQYEQVKSGHAFDNLRHDHDLVRSANTAKSKIPEAWERLVDEEDLLIEMVVEKVKDVSEGRYVPKKADVVAFLQSLKTENRTVKTTGASRARPPRRESQTFSGGSKPFYQYKINGEIHEGRNGKDIYIKVLDYIFVTYGRFQELKSHPLNRMKSRSLGTGYHISEDRIEITKEDKHKQQLPSSKIWLNTNESASSMSGKLIKIGEFYSQLENRKILGVWGSGAEVEFDIPTRPSAS
ncbi:MAG: type I restriction enzyme HsdR N-terminal domain-containing protein [Candidatus Poribacteria bacterium]|nr:type I restriction enzyme HsdR N-terminal domain-containing protein [Candidatus Poribacteria bacterium]